MELKLVRTIDNAEFTKGELYVNGIFECYTIEDTDRQLEAGGVKLLGITAIPKGTYNVLISMSNRFNKFLPIIENVPDFSGVRIHSGNSSKDTEGCIIVGAVNDRDDLDWLSSSHLAFDILYPKIKRALSDKEKVTLEIC
jgi:hypothetical protein